MSYSECRGTRSDNSMYWDAFSAGQRSSMMAHFLTFRRGLSCGAVFSKSKRESQSPAIRKREEEQAILLADLLLNNCSVAIQDVFEEETIPLPVEVLSSYSVAASQLQATPTAEDPNNPRPATVVLGTATAAPSSDSGGMGGSESNTGGSGTAKATASSVSGGTGGSTSTPDGKQSGAQMFARVPTWEFFSALLVIYFAVLGLFCL